MRDALKFTDLTTFLTVGKGLGCESELEDLIYEQGKLPYYSAFLIPTDLLPELFDLTKLSLFEGTITVVEEVNFFGTERFTTDFMIYPLSRSGFLEVQTYGSTAERSSNPFNDLEGRNMNFVINIEDGAGKEYFLAKDGNVISLADPSLAEPQVFKTGKQVNKQMDLLREKYAEVCQIYPLEQLEFEARRKTFHPD